jgi:serine-type D-Ala-D-Ala carboxypeptidase (penicillin-binding protein 5/6)
MKTLVCLIILVFPLSVCASEITADSFLLVEKESFTIIAGKNYQCALPPASTTKVMTTILALENLGEEENIVPPKQVLSIPASKLSLQPGRSYKAIDLIKGAMVESANDAAYSLAVTIAGSEERFAEMMNQKALELGARDTHFENASGLYLPDHRTSAYDLALILRYALDNRRFEEIIRTKYFVFNRGDANVKYVNHNRLLFCFEPSIGGKTGFTRASRHCYLGAFENDGRTYILAMLGSRNLWGDVCDILEYIYAEVPSKREIALAKANAKTLVFYHDPKKKEHKVRREAKKARKQTTVAKRKGPTFSSHHVQKDKTVKTSKKVRKARTGKHRH